MDIEKNSYLATMGIQTWHLKRTDSASNTDLMFISDTPFIGSTEELFNAMLYSIEVDRSLINLTFISSSQEDDSIEKQIKAARPKLLIAFGEETANFLLEKKLSLEELRGKTYSFINLPLIATYHPSHLLKNPLDKAKAFKDLQAIAGFI